MALNAIVFDVDGTLIDSNQAHVEAWITAHDAHMHQYPIVVLSDCCAAESDFDHKIALQQLQRFCDAKICLSAEFHFTIRKTSHRKGSTRAQTKVTKREA